jgi:acetyl esterase/lipase
MPRRHAMAPATSLTRRTALHLGVGGLATTLAAHGLLPTAAAAQDASPNATADDAITEEPDVPYAEVDGEPLLLDVYRPPARDRPRPAVLLFHGGGVSRGSRTDVAEPARKLAAAGYVAFAVEYRLFDEKTGQNAWPAQLDDAQRAVRWVRANAATYEIYPVRLASFGHSSGAYLAALLGVRETRDNSDPALADQSSRVNGVVDLAGASDLTILSRSERDRASDSAWLGGTLEEVPETYRDASPLAWVDAETAPFLIIHSSKDEITSAEHAQRLVAALHEAQVDVAYVEFASGGHLQPGSWLLSGPWVLAFLEARLFPER